ncbi:MAG: endonuclease III domain-containing protein [Candidatus Nanoarchaeia archaeon]
MKQIQQLQPHDLLETEKNYLSKERFIYLLSLVENKYSKFDFRLAAEGWNYPWQTLIVTMLSAQSKDERTIEIGEELFKHYPTLKSLANAKFEDILKIYKSMNYNKTKAKHTIEIAKQLIEKFNSQAPQTIDELITLPGVGRKTANLLISEEFGLPGICVDTHVQRMCNVFEFVNTQNDRDKTEKILKGLLEEKYWTPINRLFVLWGKECPSRDPQVLLNVLLQEESIYNN